MISVLFAIPIFVLGLVLVGLALYLKIHFLHIILPFAFLLGIFTVQGILSGPGPEQKPDLCAAMGGMGALFTLLIVLATAANLRSHIRRLNPSE